MHFDPILPACKQGLWPCKVWGNMLVVDELILQACCTSLQSVRAGPALPSSVKLLHLASGHPCCCLQIRWNHLQVQALLLLLLLPGGRGTKA